jgi:hypothetical protein
MLSVRIEGQYVKVLQNPTYWTWVKIVTTGEFLGFLLPICVGVISVVASFPSSLQLTSLVAAGIGEGAILGYFQAKVLSTKLTGFNRKNWILFTMVGAGIAWTIGMLPSTMGEGFQSWPLLLLVIVGTVLAVVLLLSIGLAQYLELRKYATHAHKWIWVNVVAWLAGLGVVFSFTFGAPDGLIFTILFSALGGFGMAFTMASITGIYAVRAMESGTL